VLDEVLLKNGFMLDYTLTPQPDFKKNIVLLAKDAHKESLVCLDAKLEPETVDYFKTHKDKFFICLELALDTTKKVELETQSWGKTKSHMIMEKQTIARRTKAGSKTETGISSLHCLCSLKSGYA